MRILDSLGSRPEADTRLYSPDGLRWPDLRLCDGRFVPIRKQNGHVARGLSLLLEGEFFAELRVPSGAEDKWGVVGDGW